MNQKSRYKEDIARMRETLKNPNNKHLKDSYKHRIKERQKQIAYEAPMTLTSRPRE